MNPSPALPPVAVVTVVRNDAAHIEETLLSVLQQDYPCLQYVIIDGASTDGTVAIIERYRARIDAFISEPDRGLYDAMNKGTRLSRSDTYVYFLNSGDCFAGPDALSRLFRGRGRLPAVLLAPVIRRGGKDQLLPVRKHRRIGLPTCHQGIFCRQPLLLRHAFDMRYALAADFDSYSRIARELAPDDIGVSETPVACISAGGVSDRKPLQVTREYCAIMWRARQWGVLALYAAKRMLRHAIDAAASCVAKSSIPFSHR